VHVLRKNRSRIVVADDDQLVDRPRIDRELLDGVADVAGQRPHQQEAAVLGVA
jgi:hypothetical protein